MAWVCTVKQMTLYIKQNKIDIILAFELTKRNKGNLTTNDQDFKSCYAFVIIFQILDYFWIRVLHFCLYYS